VKNPWLILWSCSREEFDDWAVLFNPDTGRGFGLSPAGVYVWKLLDGEHTIDALFTEICHHAEDVPEGAEEHIGAFIEALVAEGLAGYKLTPPTEKCSHHAAAIESEVKPWAYEPPRLVDLSGKSRVAYGDCTPGSTDSFSCTAGGTANQLCTANGTSAGGKCCTGTSPATMHNCQKGSCVVAWGCPYDCSDGGRMCSFGTDAVRCCTCNSGVN
jgi:SynChlorMet cassette protein ScmD